jgi:hypothetical protein
MTSISAAADALAYEMAVLTLYLELPDTPVSVSLADQHQARRCFQRGIPLPLIETALLLGALRRLLRPAAAPPLQPIRSLAYFQPVIEELLQRPLPDSYRTYLQQKLQLCLRDRAGAQASTG